MAARRRRPLSSPLFALVWLALAASAPALAAPPAATCATRSPLRPPGRNVFTLAQEQDLGDAVHEHVQSTTPLVEDESLNLYLARMATRLLPHLPATDLSFRFHIVDLPEANALSAPGGRVYVTRKMIASARDEDELAGVLAHEIAHGVGRHGAVAVTRELQRRGVSRLGDRRDVFDKYHLLLDGPPSDAAAGTGRDEQEAADRAAIEALACAGYRPEAFAEWWDRLHETRGRTGNWLTDLLGTTRPEMRRLRDMVRARAPGRTGVPHDVAGSAQEFRRWQEAVAAYRSGQRQEAVAGVVWKTALNPPLQPGLAHLRFSPDGRFVLAQDAASIMVASREPFALRFRIEAAGATHARFSPDSRDVVFLDHGLRVEKWDVGSGEQVLVREVVRRDACTRAALSPDGRLLACWDAGERLAVIDVERGDTVIEKRSFPPPAGRDERGMAFSDDGRFLLAGTPRTPPVAFDLAHRTVLARPDVFRTLTQRAFTFVGSDRVAALGAGPTATMTVARFPDGEILSRLPAGTAKSLLATTAGDYVLLKPFNEYAVAAVELASGKVALANRAPALDLHGDLVVNEAADGSLDLTRWRATPGERVGRLPVPEAELLGSRSLAVSPDLAWLAVSEGERGAAWSLPRGERAVHLQAFDGASIDEAGFLFADFPATARAPRARVKIDLARGQLVEEREVRDDTAFLQVAGVRVRMSRSAGAEGGTRSLQGTDAWTGDLLWTRTVPDWPILVWLVDTQRTAVAFPWPVPLARAHDALRRIPAVRARLDALGREESGFLLEVVTARTGEVVGHVHVASFMRRFSIAGDWLAVEDPHGRVLVHSLSGGDLRARFFARQAAALTPSGLLAVETSPGRLALHDLQSLTRSQEFAFPSRAVFARFDPAGTRLFVLTANQQAYLIDVTGPAAPTGR